MKTDSELKQVFLEALDLPPPERAVLLAEVAARDTGLSRRLEGLLAAHERAEVSFSVAERVLDDASHPGLQLPVVLGNYELTDELAEGGAGVVYRARQLDLGRTVAIKLLRAGRFASQDEVQRFRNEAEAAARLDHPAIVPVYEVGFDEGRHFISMKLIDGPSLDRCTARYGDDPHAAAELVAKIARAVDHGHRHGVLHRDIKPSNVLLDAAGEPYIADFGTAKIVDDAARQTVTGWVIGTPSYMSPEQASGKRETTTATDVYGLGCVLYELLVGEPPLIAETLVETLHRIQDDTAIAVRVAKPAVHRDLETICHRCLEKEPERRYPSALALAEDLERWLAFEPIQARPPTNLERLRLAWRRRPLVSSLLAIVAALSVALVVGTAIAGFQLRTALDRTHDAENLTRTHLRSAYVAEAQALRRGGEIGRRARGLGLLARAAAIRPGMDLVNEGIANLTLTDLVTIHTWPRRHDDIVQVQFDANFERYFLGRMNGDMELRRVSDDSLITTLANNGQPAWRAHFSSDGQYLAVTHHSYSAVPRFDVWDLERGAIVMSFPKVPRGRGDFAPDRPAFVVCWQDGRVEEHDLSTLDSRTILQLDTESFSNSMRYSPSGDRIGIADEAGRVRIYGLDGVLLSSLEAGGEHLYRLDWSDDGTRVAAGSMDSIAYVWNVESQALEATLVGHSADVVHVAFVHDQVLATYSWDGTTRLWSIPTGATLATIEEALVHASSVSGLVGFRATDQIHVRALVHGDVLRVLHGHDKKAPHSLSVDPAGERLVSAGENELFLWDLASGERIDEIERAGVRDLEFAGDGSLLVCTDDGLERFALSQDGFFEKSSEVTPGDFAEIEVDSSAELHALMGGGKIHLLRFDDRGDYSRLAAPLGVSGLSLSSDGQWVAVGNGGGSGAHVFRTSDGAPETHIAVGETYCNVRFSPGGRWLAVGTRSNYLVYRVGTWELAHETSRGEENTGNARAMRYSPDSMLLAATLDRRRVGLMDTRTGTTLAILETPERQGPTDARFTPDGRHLLVSTELNRILVWDLERLRTELETHGLDGPLGPGWSLRLESETSTRRGDE